MKRRSDSTSGGWPPRMALARARAGRCFREMKRRSPVKKQNDHPGLRKISPIWDVAPAAMKNDVVAPNSGADGKISALVAMLTTEVMIGTKSARDALRAAATTAQREVDIFWARVPAKGKQATSSLEFPMSAER